MKPFNLEAALAGEPVWHVCRNLPISNLVQIGNRVAFTIPNDGDFVYQVKLDGVTNLGNGETILAMAPKSKTFYVNLWDSPSFHYTRYTSLLAAKGATGVTYSGRRFPKLNKEPIEITVED